MSAGATDATLLSEAAEAPPSAPSPHTHAVLLPSFAHLLFQLFYHPKASSSHSLGAHGHLSESSVSLGTSSPAREFDWSSSDQRLLDQSGEAA